MRQSQRNAMQNKARSHRQANLTLVYGPPCAGKTTFALSEAERTGGVVVDYDLVAQELGSPVTHGHSMDLHGAILAEVQRRLDASRSATAAWLVKCEPTRTDLLRASKRVLVDPGREECLDRAARSRPDDWPRLIDKWYASNSNTGSDEGGVTPRGVPD